MERAARLDYLIAQARAADPDRYLCALFAPAERREPVLAVALLNRELARVPALVTQPVAGLIRYQWWREAIREVAAGGPARDQPVVEGLAVGLAAGWLDAAGLEALVDGREAEIEEPAPVDLPSLEARLDATEGATQELTLACLGGEGPERRAARLVGTALGLATAAAGCSGEAFPATRAALAERAAGLLAEARRLAPRPPVGRMAAFLPARLARGRFRRSAVAASAGVRRPAAGITGLILTYFLRRY